MYPSMSPLDCIIISACQRALTLAHPPCPPLTRIMSAFIMAEPEGEHLPPSLQTILDQESLK